MTRKRKVNYAELLREQQGSAPGAPAHAPVSTEAPSAATPEVVPVAPDAGDPAPAAEPDPAREPAPERRAKQPRKREPGEKAPRRRAADRATSPIDLASALNERKTFERTRRGETPVPPVAAISAIGPGEAPAESRGPGAESAATAEIDPAAERPSAALAALTGDTMEFAVTSVVNAIPFRERVRARTGRAELLLFRIGRELFATALSAVEEAVELAEIRTIPEMSREMLGVFDLRGRMIPIYTPAIALGVPLAASPQAALVVRSGDRRMALAVDDVEDVLDADLATVRAAPGTDDGDGVLLGVVRHGRSLVAVLDGEALVNACLSDRVPETA